MSQPSEKECVVRHESGDTLHYTMTVEDSGDGRHFHTRITRVLPYSGPVSRDENRAAHGGVRVEVEREDGARRFENINGKHVEVGSWGPSQEERRLEAQRAEARAAEIRASRPAPVTVRRGEAAVVVSIADDGTLVLDALAGRYSSADEVSIARGSGLVPYAAGLRTAVLLAEELRAAVQ
jgi:hypothetical protein